MIARASHLLSQFRKPTAGASAAPVVARPHRDVHLIPRNRDPWNPTDYELWVENGVVWDLQRSWILGFIDYPSIAPYFAQTTFVAAPQIFAGAPFSLNDFPTYGFQLRLTSGQVVPYSYYIFSSLSMLSYLPNAWPYFTSFGLTRHFGATPPAGAAPVVPAADLQWFVAGSPSGPQRFRAGYVTYAPPEQYWTYSYHFWPVG
jgi:hypothetical protein